MTLRAILFDFDGTLAETERHGHRVAYNRAFAELGLDWEWDEALYGKLLQVAGGLERLRHYRAAYRPHEGPADDDFAATIHRTKGRHFAGLVPSIALRPGVMRLVCEARAAGVAVAIATTASDASVEAFLEGHPDLAAALSLVAAGEVVAQKKPAPDVYRYALERLGCAANDAVAVEDSNVGLRAALAAGLRTIVTPSDYTTGEDFSGASAVVADLDRAPAASGREPGVVDLAYLRALPRS